MKILNPNGTEVLLLSALASFSFGNYLSLVATLRFEKAIEGKSVFRRVISKKMNTPYLRERVRVEGELW